MVAECAAVAEHGLAVFAAGGKALGVGCFSFTVSPAVIFLLLILTILTCLSPYF